MNDGTEQQEVKQVDLSKEAPLPPSGFMMYDGKDVAVQLVQPWVAGIQPNGEFQLVDYLMGRLKVTRSHTPTGILFLLELKQPDGRATAYVSIFPEDVKHVTFIERSSIVAP